LYQQLEETAYHVAEGNIDAYVQSANSGIHSAWRKANDRVLWRRIIDTATLGAHHWRKEYQRKWQVVIIISLVVRSLGRYDVSWRHHITGGFLVGCSCCVCCWLGADATVCSFGPANII